MQPPTSPLDGTISKLPRKLDRLLRLPRGCILPKGVEDEIPLIKRDLEKIVSILSNLQLQEQDDSAMMVRCWRKEVRELSYDMEDFVDEYEHVAASARSLTGSVRRRRQRPNSKAALPWLLQKLRQRLWMANKIREFSVRAQEALQRSSFYNLDAIVAGSASSTISTADASSSSWNFTRCGGDNDYVGISDAMEKLEELLMMKHDEGHQRLKVVSIVGFGGIGKTTLANELYRKLGLQFECRAFVRTSQKPDMRRTFISMLSQVCPHQLPENWTVHNLISTIRRHLQDKRYLIVIEDVWGASTWDILKLPLPDGNCCSRVLTTTEIEDIALHSCGYDSKYVFKMKPLGDDDSRKLFFSSVFSPQHECPPELKEVSCDIIRKCGGLPLAIVTIASIFARQLGIKEKLDFINKSLGYSLITNPTSEGMKQVLDLSYNNLPQNLKACILYTSLYEEDIIIWRDDLVNQWIAEGFISVTGEQDKQEISRAYFDELVGRKMIQPVYVKDTGEVLSCVVHHMVLNLITTYKSIEENFVTVIHHSQATTTLADKIRRLSLQYGNAGDAMQPKNMRLSQARTLAYFGVFCCMPSIVEFHLLQVLILHVWGDKDSIMLDLTRISELFRLRYLKVSSNVTLELHPHMQGLQSLETLTIDARVKAVPSDIIHLRRLLHLNLLEQTNLPYGIGHMMSLETLGCFDVSTNMMENVHSLGMLTNLRDLRLTYSAVQPEITNDKIQLLLNSILGRLSKLNSLTLVPSVLGRLSKLNSLTLVPSVSFHANSLDDTGATRTTISGGFSNMSCASTILHSLKVSPRICMFFCPPNWIGQIFKLSILKIGVRKIDSDGVDILGGLPALAVLSLYVQTKPAARIVIGKTGFPVIKYFKFKCCDPLLKFEEDAMPNLNKLKIVFNACNANQQSTMPVGIRYLSNLKEVCANIGGATDDSYRMAAELDLRDSINVHARRPRVNIQRVKQIICCVGDQTSIAPEEEYGNLRQKEKLDEKDSHEHDEIMRTSGEEVNIDANYRSTLSELHILLLLRNNLDNLPDDITRSIPIIDVYSYDPWNLAEIDTCHGGLFFFRPMQEARATDPIETPSGYWQNTGLPGYIYSAERFPIGMKITMEFYSGHVTSATQTKWKIKEFIAFQNAAAAEPRTEMSLCQLYTEVATSPAGGDDGDSAAAGLVVTELGHIRELVRQLEVQLGGSSDLCRDLAAQIFSNTERSISLITSPHGLDGGRKRPSTDVVTTPSLLSEASHAPFKTTKKGKVMKERRVQVRVSSAVGWDDRLDDGHSWRKYVQKDVIGAKHTRAYYRCTNHHSRGCMATKQVQRNDEDPTLFDVVYYDKHTCVPEAVTQPREDNTLQSLSSALTLKTEDAEWQAMKVNVEEVGDSENVSTSAPSPASTVDTLDTDVIPGNGDSAAVELAVTELSHIKELARQLEVHLGGSSDLCRDLAAQISDTARAISLITSRHLDGGRKRPAADVAMAPSLLSDASDMPFKTTKKREVKKERRVQVRVSSAVDCNDALDDGYSWRKYGQKDILGAKHPRAYFRCTHRNSRGCLATKQVQRTNDDLTLFDVMYHGEHTCVPEARGRRRRTTRTPTASGRA